MPLYELRVLGTDNRITSTQEMESTDDDEAFTMAKRYLDGHAMEVWEGKRFIGTVEPAPGPDAFSWPSEAFSAAARIISSPRQLSAANRHSK
jgi:hypothetical protein